MIPATNVPWPAPRSRYPPCSDSGNSSSGSILPPRGTSSSHPSVRLSAEMPVSMIATLVGVPGKGPAGQGPGDIAGRGPLVDLTTGAVGVMLLTDAANPRV